MISKMCKIFDFFLQKTATDLLEKNYDVHVVADAVSSRSQVYSIFLSVIVSLAVINLEHHYGFRLIVCSRWPR